VTDLPTTAGELDPELRSALRRHILTLADSKRVLGIRYSDWLLGSPSIETGIAASSMAQDEWGHARLLYAMLKDLGEDPVHVEQERAVELWASVDALDEPVPDWGALVGIMVAVDGALSVALEGFAGGRYDPARSRVPKMLAEEEFHRDLGLAWFRRLGSGSAEAAAHLSRAVTGLLPRTLAWLAPEDRPYTLLAEAGIVPAGTDLLARYRERWGAALEGAGVDVHGTHPERSAWDEDRSRGPGHPGLEAVERARGDRNRALFVE